MTTKQAKVAEARLPTTFSPTVQLAHEIEQAYNWFNERLFQGKLKRCVVLFHRKKSAHGYFWAKRWKVRDGEEQLHEIAINPDDLRDREVKHVLSTLVHEQVHLWQEDFGKPPKRAHHNKEWADKMEEIGLMPSNTGEVGGKRTGRRVTHYIMENGEFDLACDELLETGHTLSVVSWPFVKPKKPKTPRVTLECPQECGTKCRAKEDVVVRCGICKDEETGEYVELEPV